jgi:hypothetical protein
MAISRDEVVHLFRCFLGRYPNETDILWWMENILTFDDGRIALLNSAEFLDKWFPASPYIPQKPSGPLIKAEDQKLAVVSIVKNEADRIAHMITSCAPFADRFVILDTGSTDSTEIVIRDCVRHHNKPLTFSSVDFVDFAHARNTALRLVPDDIQWILMLDADEHIVEEDYQPLLDLLPQPYEGWRLPRYNFSDIDKKKLPSPYPDYQFRLFRNNPDNPVKFVGLVHEHPIGVSHWRAVATSDAQHNGPSGGPHIHHMGHVTTSTERMQIKHNLYNDLMRKSRE